MKGYERALGKTTTKNKKQKIAHQQLLAEHPPSGSLTLIIMAKWHIRMSCRDPAKRAWRGGLYRCVIWSTGTTSNWADRAPRAPPIPLAQKSFVEGCTSGFSLNIVVPTRDLLTCQQDFGYTPPPFGATDKRRRCLTSKEVMKIPWAGTIPRADTPKPL